MMVFELKVLSFTHAFVAASSFQSLPLCQSLQNEKKDEMVRDQNP